MTYNQNAIAMASLNILNSEVLRKTFTDPIDNTEVQGDRKSISDVLTQILTNQYYITLLLLESLNIDTKAIQQKVDGIHVEYDRYVLG